MSEPVSGDFLQWLRTFILVAETESIHRAAGGLCISPSAVSHQIRKLEQDLDLTLFDRKNKGMRLTHEGVQFKDKSVPILEAVEKLRTEKLHQPALRGQIRLSCISRHVYHLMPDILAFKELHPEVRFSVDSITTQRSMQRLEQGAVDMAILVYSGMPGHLVFTPLRPSSAYLYTPPGNPYKLPEKPSWDQICELPFIALTLEGYVNPVVPVLPELRQPKDVLLAVNDFVLALQLVRGGIGVCIAPPITRFESPGDYTLFNIDHVFPIGTFGLLTRRDGYLSIQARAFMEYLKRQYALREKAGGKHV